MKGALNRYIYLSNNVGLYVPRISSTANIKHSESSMYLIIILRTKACFTDRAWFLNRLAFAFESPSFLTNPKSLQ